MPFLVRLADSHLRPFSLPAGLSPEYIQFSAGGMRVGAPYNLLRPEALEAFWYMWRMTKDWKYRTWAWEVFQAFQTQCKVRGRTVLGVGSKYRQYITFRLAYG